MRSETAASCPVSGSDCKNAMPSAMDRRHISWMFLPPTVTERLSFFRRAPPQAGHSLMLRYRSSSSRTSGESDSRQRRSRFGMIPSKGFSVKCRLPPLSV